jgi:hypothetical protein
MAWRKRTSFWLVFDSETLELIRIRPMDRKGKVFKSPGDSPVADSALVTVIKAKDEASLRRDYDFKSIPLDLHADREAQRELFEEVIESLVDPEERRAMQLCISRKSPKHTIAETAAELGREEALVRVALDKVYRGVTLRRIERQSRI